MHAGNLGQDQERGGVALVEPHSLCICNTCSLSRQLSVMQGHATMHHFIAMETPIDIHQPTLSIDECNLVPRPQSSPAFVVLHGTKAEAEVKAQV